MKDINARLIDSIPEERIATREDMANMKDSLLKTLSSRAMAPFGKGKGKEKENDKDISKYLIPFPPKNKTRDYIPDLEAALENMKMNEEQENKTLLMKDIDYITQHYKEHLLLNEVLEIYLILARKLLEQDDFDTIELLLEKLQHHEKDLNIKQRRQFFYFLWLFCFKKALVQQDDKALYAASIEYFNKIIWPQLDEDMYMTILYRKSFALSMIGKYRASISVIKEFLNISEEYEEDDEDIRKQRMRSFLLKGDMHMILGENKEAIESFRHYLLYNPHDEEVKKTIESLQSEQSE